jgi:hypothetical protein
VEKFYFHNSNLTAIIIKDHCDSNKQYLSISGSKQVAGQKNKQKPFRGQKRSCQNRKSCYNVKSR